jgi:hypothetical protein
MKSTQNRNIQIGCIIILILSVVYFMQTCVFCNLEGFGEGKRWNQPAKKDIPGYVPTEQAGNNPAIIPHRFTYPFNSPQN